MKVGLVLGAGGVAGGAWLTGALQALASETGWDPGSADHIVGTSAGSVVGAFTAAGVPPWFMVAHSQGEVFDGLVGPDGRPAADADRSGGASVQLHRGLPGIGPGSWRLALSSLRHPSRTTPLAMAVGWMPRGFISTEPLKNIVRRTVVGSWVEHPNFWAVACDYATGKRVPFGREDAPPAQISDAVAASCAIPGFYHPVSIGGRRYIDGGVRSASNLDLLGGRDLDVVICLNPTSTLSHQRGLNPLDLMVALTRTASGRRLGYEAKRLRESGTKVVLIQPRDEDLAALGRNLMSGRRRDEVITAALHSVGDALRETEVADLLGALPPGEPHKVGRPDGPPSGWPQIVPGQRAA